MNTERLKTLLAEYGPVAAATYFAIFFLVLGGFAFALSQGLSVGGVDMNGATGAGVLGAAYVATKLTQPIRIGATLVLTPLVAVAVRRMRSGATSEPKSQAEPSE